MTWILYLQPKEKRPAFVSNKGPSHPSEKRNKFPKYLVRSARFLSEKIGQKSALAETCPQEQIMIRVTRGDTSHAAAPASSQSAAPMSDAYKT